MAPPSRGQGLPLNTIIISIIVIVVLVVVILIFVGNIGPWNENVRSCAAQGGSCNYADEAACTAAGGQPGNGNCDSGFCCVTLAD